MRTGGRRKDAGLVRRRPVSFGAHSARLFSQGYRLFKSWVPDWEANEQMVQEKALNCVSFTASSTSVT